MSRKAKHHWGSDVHSNSKGLRPSIYENLNIPAKVSDEIYVSNGHCSTESASCGDFGSCEIWLRVCFWGKITILSEFTGTLSNSSLHSQQKRKKISEAN